MNKYLNIYPRPQFKRNSYYCLNGLWGLNNDFIEVPFPKESKLSQYPNKQHEDKLEYLKTFILPEGFFDDKKRVILHFEAIDQICEVYLNEQYIGKHIGGYLPFSFDITDYLKFENVLVVKAIDNLDKFYPYGKQCAKPHGMWYTPVSGIWGSVWIEAIPKIYSINNIKIDTTINTLDIEVDTDAPNYEIEINFDDYIFIDSYNDKHVHLDIDELNVKYQNWSLDNPKLYDLIIRTETDEIASYFALREITTKTINGYKRLFLNNEPLFINGVLDQGYFEEGIFLPKDPKEYIKDIENMKELGFNLLRKHIKVEPDIFYYYCDLKGILVMQDMVNSGEIKFIGDTLLPTIDLIKANDEKNIDIDRYNFFIEHSIGIIKHLYNHPSIIAWTIYNEGWGQQNSTKAYHTLKKYDEHRLFDTASGWFKPNNSDIDSYHVYFRNKVLKTVDKNKVLLLSEFGGIVRKIEGHIFKDRDANYGYGKQDSEEALSKKIVSIYDNMVIPSIKNGLCGCIYTQVSDVEEEVNGLYTYDRQVCKVNKIEMQKINEKVNKEYFKYIED